MNTTTTPRPAPAPAKRPKRTLTKKQKTFLRILEQKCYHFSSAMTESKVTQAIMDRWFEDPLFRKTLLSRYRQVDFLGALHNLYSIFLSCRNVSDFTYYSDPEIGLRASTALMRYQANAGSNAAKLLAELDRLDPDSQPPNNEPDDAPNEVPTDNAPPDALAAA